MSQPKPAEEPRKQEVPSAGAGFHAHLVVCKRCANQIFDLCPVGNILLLATATGRK